MSEYGPTNYIISLFVGENESVPRTGATTIMNEREAGGSYGETGVRVDPGSSEKCIEPSFERGAGLDLHPNDVFRADRSGVGAVSEHGP